MSEILDSTHLASPVSPLTLRSTLARTLVSAEHSLLIVLSGTVRPNLSTDVSRNLQLLVSSGPDFSEHSPTVAGMVLTSAKPTPLPPLVLLPELHFSKFWLPWLFLSNAVSRLSERKVPTTCPEISSGDKARDAGILSTLTSPLKSTPKSNCKNWSIAVLPWLVCMEPGPKQMHLARVLRINWVRHSLLPTTLPRLDISSLRVSKFLGLNIVVERGERNVSFPLASLGGAAVWQCINNPQAVTNPRSK